MTGNTPLLNAFEERRTTPRVPPGEDLELTLQRSHKVRLIEISVTGALLRTSFALDIGQRVELQTRLGDHTFAAEVEVRRVVAPARGALQGYTLGVTFVSLDADNMRCLERFLRQPAPR
jgi:hypothetical protein